MAMMKRLCLALAFVALAGSAFAAQVAIQVGAYQGRYYIPGIGGPFYGNQTFDLPAGSYQLDNGTEIGGSALAFDVDDGGNVSDVSPAAAATANGTTLALNTVTIAIAAGSYTGRYFLTIFGTSMEFHGSQMFAVMPALAYAIDTGAEAAVGAASSDFIFTVDDVGDVTTSSPAAHADGTTSTLSFVTVPIQINPQAYTAPYIVSAFAPTEFIGPQTMNVPPGLVYTIDNGQEIGGSAFAIVVDASGNVSTPSGAATASGNALTFVNVVVHVDPTAAGGPVSIGPYTNLTQPTDVILMPTLAVVVTTPTGSAIAVPTTGAIETVPPLTDVTLSGTPFNTTRQTKVDLLAQLETLRAGATDPLARGLLDFAIASVTASLDASLWNADGMHLNPACGGAVFELEKDAALAIDLVAAWRHSIVDPQALRALVVGFAGVDRQLAATAIADAGTGPVGDARQDLAQGDADLAHGRDAAAFDRYRDAWQDATHPHGGRR